MAAWIQEHKTLCVGGGLGVLTALAEIFSDTVKHHPHWALASGVVAAGMIIIPLIPHRPDKFPETDARNTNVAGRDAGNQASGSAHVVDSGNKASNVAGKDNSGSQISVAGDAHFHLPPRETPPKPEPQEATSNSTPSPQSPSPRITSISSVFAGKGGGRFSKKEGNDIYIVASVENPVAPVGKRTSIARGIGGRITFSTPHGIQRNVARAFWLDTEINTVTILVGEIKQLVIGRVVDSVLHYYDNDCKVAKKFHSRMVIEAIHPRTDLPLHDFVTAEINLLDTRTGETLDHESCVIRLLHPNIAEIEVVP